MGATRDANIMGVAIELMAGRALPLIHGCPVPQWHRRGAGRTDTRDLGLDPGYLLKNENRLA